MFEIVWRQLIEEKRRYKRLQIEVMESATKANIDRRNAQENRLSGAICMAEKVIGIPTHHLHRLLTAAEEHKEI